MSEFVQNNPLLISINLIMLIVMWYVMQPAILYKEGVVSPARLYFTLFTWFLFDIFAFWGSDWFHLYVAYKDIMNGTPIVEDIYTWIAGKLAPDNYYFFRIIVWGLAQLLLWDTFKRLSVSSHLILAVFIGVWMIWFSFGRFSLALALVFWGLTIYHNSNRLSLLPKVIGICAIAVSFFFHKSAIFLIVVSFLTILTSNINKMTYVFSIITFPILVHFLSAGFIDTFLLMMTDRVEDLNNYIVKAQHYMEADKSSNGIGPLIGLLLEKIPYYLISALGIIAVLKADNAISSTDYVEYDLNETCDDNQYSPVPDDIKMFVRVLFFILLLSSILLFSDSANTQVIYDRFTKFSLVPAAIVLAYLFDNDKYFRYAWWTYCIALFGTFYQMVYVLYCSITNSK